MEGMILVQGKEQLRKGRNTGREYAGFLGV